MRCPCGKGTTGDCGWELVADRGWTAEFGRDETVEDVAVGVCLIASGTGGVIAIPVRVCDIAEAGSWVGMMMCGRDPACVTNGTEGEWGKPDVPLVFWVCCIWG